MIWEDLGIFFINSDWQFSQEFDSNLVRITHLSVPLRQDYVKAALAHAFQDDLLISLFNPRRLTCRQEKEVFNFVDLPGISKKLAFKRLDANIDIIWKIKLEYKTMLVPSNKLRTTTAQSLPDITVSNVKVMILREKIDSSRQNYLLTNTGSQTVFFKYVPLGVDPASDTLLVSPSNWDFFVEGGRQWFDQTFSQNGLIAIAANANQAVRIKAIEYNYL